MTNINTNTPIANSAPSQRAHEAHASFSNVLKDLGTKGGEVESRNPPPGTPTKQGSVHQDHPPIKGSVHQDYVLTMSTTRPAYFAPIIP